MKRIVLIAISLLICLLFSITSVSAYSVGDDVSFNANNIKPQNNGFQNTVIRTEQEQRMDNANWTNNDYIRRKYKQIVQENATNDNWFANEYEDRIIYTQNVITNKNILDKISDLMYDYYSRGYYYTINNSNGFGDMPIKDLNLKQYDFNKLHNIANNYGYSPGYMTGNLHPLYSIGYFDFKPPTPITPNLPALPNNEIKFQFTDPYKTTLTAKQRQDLLNKFWYLGGDVVRDTEMGNTIMDFKNYPQRLKALEIYLDSIKGTDNILTQRIIEVKVNSKSQSKLWTSVPQTWGTTGQSHFWEIECTKSYDNNYHAPITRYGNSQITQTFYFPGQYHVTATQVLKQKYCETISYDVNEYWIVADTGQVIYKSESNGSAIPSDNKKPLSQAGLSQVTPTKTVEEGIFYVPVLDTSIDVTQGSWSYDMTAPGMWGFNFKSQRIK